MLSSYCYFFSQSPATAPDLDPSSPRIREHRPSRNHTEATHDHRINTKAHALWTDTDDYLRSAFSDLSSSASAHFETVSSFIHKATTQPDGPVQSTLSKLSLPSVTSWFAPSSSDPAPTKPAPAQTASLSVLPTSQPLQPQEPSELTKGKTTFTFVLFGAASSAAVYLLVRDRRAMNRLQAAKSLAYRDARAWRRVALDFARINALAAGRVQNIVAASLRDGQAGKDIGRQIERELQEASRAVVQRRNWIREQDAKDAQASSSSQGSLADVWSEMFDLERSGFFFGSRGGRPFGRWQSGHVARHDDVSEVPSDGVAFRPTEAWTRAAATPTERRGDQAASPAKRSAQLKWQRVAGHAAAVAGPPAVDHSSWSAKSVQGANAAVDIEDVNETPEEWIGDVDRALRERDLKCSQERTQEVETSEESDDHLLPVSDLSIATDGRMRDEPDHAAIASKRAGNDVAASKQPPADLDVYDYPISDKFRDMEDIFMASWDDNFAGLSSSVSAASATEPMPDKAQVAKVGPNSALFDRLRAARKLNKKETSVQSADDIEFLAELMFPQAALPRKADEQAPEAVVAAPKAVTSSEAQTKSQKIEHEEQLVRSKAELDEYRLAMRQLSERVDAMRETCHELTDEAQRREKTHKIQIEQLEHKIGLLTVWADEVQRRMGLETPPFFDALRKPLIRRD